MGAKEDERIRRDEDCVENSREDFQTIIALRDWGLLLDVRAQSSTFGGETDGEMVVVSLFVLLTLLSK